MLLAVLGGIPPKSVVVNELTTIASVWTSAQFLKGEVLSGTKLGLHIAAGNVPNLVDLETGGFGPVIQDPMNSSQTATLATFGTLGDLLAGCITRVQGDACQKFFAAATPPGGVAPNDTLTAAQNIARNPSNKAQEVFALLDAFYPVAAGKRLRPVPFIPYLSFAPPAWTLSLVYAGGGVNSPGGIAIDGEGPDFCAGADLAALEQMLDAPRQEHIDDAKALGHVFHTIRRIEKPVVALDFGGAQEVVEHGKSGFLVHDGDLADLAQTLLRLLRDPALRSRMGAYGREAVETRFTPGRMARDMEQVYEAVLRS